MARDRSLRAPVDEMKAPATRSQEGERRCRQAPELTDQELVKQSKLGNEDAMAELIRRHYVASLRIAWSILRNGPDS